MSSTEIWKRFVDFWTAPVEDEQSEWPKFTFPTEMVDKCDLEYDTCLGFCEIYILEDWGDGDVRPYCEDCYWRRDDELSAYREESDADRVYREKKNFLKFFRNWHYGLIDDQQISEYNNTCWTDEELMEIFPILQMYVQMDDEYAKKLDDHMASWKELAEKILNWE